MTKPRARDLGLDFRGEPGATNSIADVPGVLVGFTTLLEPEGGVRTGVTAILPRGRGAEMQPVWAGFHALNGNGEMTGTHWIREAGYFLSPVCITNTHSVGIAHHAATRWMLDQHAEQFSTHHLWAMPVVAETYDGVLNDINGQHVTAGHVRAAIEGAGAGPVAEGNVGGGTGMISYEFKGGTGTASRRLRLAGEERVVAALVQANHGLRPWLSVLGVPVGEHLAEDRLHAREQGSIIVVLGCDIPLLPSQLTRISKRAGLGIGRNGTPGGNNSGDIFLAFSTANPMPLHQLGAASLRLDFLNDEELDPVYLAVVEAVEEAVINALVAAEDMTTLKPAGRICRAIDHGRLVAVMRRFGRCR